MLETTRLMSFRSARYLLANPDQLQKLQLQSPTVSKRQLRFGHATCKFQQAEAR